MDKYEKLLEKIEYYRSKKQDNIFDVFYHSDLDLMVDLIREKQKSQLTVREKMEKYKQDSGYNDMTPEEKQEELNKFFDDICELNKKYNPTTEKYNIFVECPNCEHNNSGSIRCKECCFGTNFSELWNADQNCVHNVVSANGGGVRCTKCGGWFCF